MHREQFNKAPQGWYPDPAHASTERYWNGSGWTDQIRIVSTPSPIVPAGFSGKGGLSFKRRTWLWFSGLSLKKKVGVGFAGLIALSALGNAAKDEAPAPQSADNVASDTLRLVDETTTTVLLTPIEDFVAAPQASSPPSAEANPESSPDGGIEISEAEAGRIVYIVSVRSRFPMIDLALNLNPGVEDTLFELGEDVCNSGRKASSIEEFMLVLLYLWNRMESSTQSFFNEEYEGFVEYSAVAMGSLCPGEAERLRS